MKLDQKSNIEAHSTAVGVTQHAMGIRAEDMPHIMGVLTDLYTNRPRAVIREYSTNAHDAHIAAGVTRPIEVELPRMQGVDYRGMLTVRDFGSGLDAEDIAAVYSQYGRSTKRDSNDFNGALGLGCKAALTYCSLFTVESVKDAVKTIVEISRAEGGGGVMKVIAEMPTTEPNGTKVAVPVGRTDMQRFATEAQEFYSYWKPGTVLVNGSEPQHFMKLGALGAMPLKLANDFYIKRGAGHDRIIMGNVAYPAPQLQGVIPRASITAFVPLGDVHFPASRESLADTAQTRRTIERLREQIPAALAAAVQRDVDTAPDGPAVIAAVLRWKDLLPDDLAPNWAWKAIPLPLKIELPLAGGASYADAGKYKLGLNGRPLYDEKGNREPVVPDAAWNRKTTENAYRQADAPNIRAVDIWSVPDTVWVEDFKPENFASVHKRKLRKHYQDTYGVYPSRDTVWVLLRGKTPAEALPWVKQARIVDYDTIKKIEFEPRKRYVDGTYKARIPGSYDCYIDGKGKSGLPGAEFPDSYPIFYRHGNQYGSRSYAQAIAALFPHSIVVCLSANRIDKFKRDVPSAVECSDAIKGARDKWVKGLTADQRLALTIHDTSRSLPDTFRRLGQDTMNVNDPDLRKAVRVCTMVDIKALLAARDGFSLVDRNALADTKRAYTVTWDNPLEKYPLFSTAYTEQSIRYLNAEYRHLNS